MGYYAEAAESRDAVAVEATYHVEQMEPSEIQADMVQELKAFEQQSDPKQIHTFTLSELMNAEFEVRPPIVDGLLYPGVFLLVGAEKIGKSFLVLQIAYTVATGKQLWERQTSGCEVLYLSLEDSKERLQRRSFRMFDAVESERLHFATECSRVSDGLVDELERYLRLYPGIRLIIIDTLQRVREVFTDHSYAKDYDVISTIKQFADSRGLCILFVHHTRKQEAKDEFEMVSGTRGLTGASDGNLIMRKPVRTDPYATLQATGRDVEDQKLYLKRDPKHMLWELERVESGAEIEPPDPLFAALDALLTPEHPMWQGTATELRSVLQTERSEKSLGMWLKIHRTELLTHHDICCRHHRTGGQRTIVLSREG